MKRKDGFPGQISFVLPMGVIDSLKMNNLTKALYITDIGYFPHAKFHFRKRDEGCEQHILIYNISGEGYIFIDKKKHILEPNHFFVIPANTPHVYNTNAENPWSIYWIHFEGETSKYFSRFFGKVNEISPSPVARIEERISFFTEIFTTLNYGYSRPNLEYINMLLWHLLASFMYIDQYRLIRKGHSNDSVSNSISFMRRNIDKNLKLIELSDLVNLSVSHYSKIFSQKTGCSPIEYFIQLKIQKACQYLEFTDLPISEICCDLLGYDDKFYFSRIFKKIMNMSPRDYRKKIS